METVQDTATARVVFISTGVDGYLNDPTRNPDSELMVYSAYLAHSARSQAADFDLITKPLGTALILSKFEETPRRANIT